MTKVLYVERKRGEFVSIEKAFRQVAAALPDRFRTEFQQTPFGTRAKDTFLNLLFFRRKGADIYHATGHINYIALLLPPERSVLSIMDLRFIHGKSRLRNFVLKKLYLDLPVRRLKYITTISEQVRMETIESTGCAPEKIRMLDLPLLDHLKAPQSKPFNAVDPVLLQVGTMPNKNLENLAKALSGLQCKLRIIGRLSEAQIRILKDNRVTFTSAYDLSDEQMQAEYAAADVITFCSTYEGFGLPIIEGQAMGKPVITSDRSPMRETSGGSACLVDPDDPSSISSGVERIIRDAEYREDLTRRGFENVGRFSPGRVAEQYAALYDEILENLPQNRKAREPVSLSDR